MTNKLKSTDAYSANILQRKENNNNALYYLHRDYLGSILAITNSAGGMVEKRHFDAWGNVLFVQDGQNNNLNKLTFLERGYTGHEHLQGVGLINMNARLYDAKLHRFLAPDNFVQDATNSQNYNRYGYVLNNPMKYKDPSGELFVFTIFNAVVETLQNVFTHGINFNHYDYHQTNMSFKIDMGMFHTDSNRDFWDRVWQFVSRFTWESPQSTLGFLYSNFRNLNEDVDRVEYFGGATFVINENSSKRNGVSLGNNINIDIRGTFNQENHPRGWMFGEDGLYWHEYGHTFQSERYGISYLFAIGIPSMFSAKSDDHHTKPYERQANRWARRYLEQHNIHWHLDESRYPN